MEILRRIEKNNGKIKNPVISFKGIPENNEIESTSEVKKNLSEKLNKLNNLLKEGVLTQEEFEKAKKKILDN